MDMVIKKVLVVEDDSTSFRVTQFIFDEQAIPGLHFCIERAETLALAVERVKRGDIAVIILDLKLPDSHGMATFDTMKEAAGNIPIVILTAAADDSEAVTYVNRGARRYITKGSVCNRALVRIVRVVTDIATDVVKV